MHTNRKQHRPFISFCCFPCEHILKSLNALQADTMQIKLHFQSIFLLWEIAFRKVKSCSFPWGDRMQQYNMQNIWISNELSQIKAIWISFVNDQSHEILHGLKWLSLKPNWNMLTPSIKTSCLTLLPYAV